MATEWHPTIVRRTLSGASASSLSAVGGWFLGIGMGCLVVGLVLLWVADEPVLAAVVALPGALGVLAGRVLDTMSGTRAAREHAAGYATLLPGTGPADVEHVDHRTGRLVSFAGEDLTRADRRARVAAIRADARLGAGQPDPVLAASGGGSPDHTDEELFAGRSRTFVTLPWGLRNGVTWGAAVVGLAPLGFIVFGMLHGDPATRSAARVILTVVVASGVVAGVGLVIALRRADRFAPDPGPGGSSWSRGVVLGLWCGALAVAVIVAVLLVLATVDVGGVARFVSAAGLDLAAMLSAVWAVPWFVAWIVLVLRVPPAPEDSSAGP
ncbi:hypothetical protein GCM10010413_00710 [Promicromonospora sukumoe]|uniref:Uncharacterized protein n=1 Tax=Promicromonospora sukumoe TaxID=88382 RepID=A0A7W3JEE0_9MICO|nr:hypothetical protein [Promicromonospora sukumoe]MBA8811327.1 hypothetical protein [Promicromonospora sukumoe]